MYLLRTHTVRIPFLKNVFYSKLQDRWAVLTAEDENGSLQYCYYENILVLVLAVYRIIPVEIQ